METVLVEWLRGPDGKRGDIATHLLSRHRRIGLLLDACELGGLAQVRALGALGELPRETVRLAAGHRLTPSIVSILEPMWYTQESWLNAEGQDGLRALEVQKVRFDPTNPADPWQTGIN